MCNIFFTISCWLPNCYPAGKEVALAPAFSEYDLWAWQKSCGQKREFIRCYTRLGAELAKAMSGENSEMISHEEPYYAANSGELKNDCGLITRTNAQGSWVSALYWDQISTNQLFTRWKKEFGNK